MKKTKLLIISEQEDVFEVYKLLLNEYFISIEILHIKNNDFIEEIDFSKFNIVLIDLSSNEYFPILNKLSKMAYLTAEKKQELFGQYGKSNTDTGSPESQIALFSYRISHLTEHLKSNKHDFGTQRSLLRLVGKRRALLEYLKEVDIERYRAIVKTLNLRK